VIAVRGGGPRAMRLADELESRVPVGVVAPLADLLQIIDALSGVMLLVGKDQSLVVLSSASS
jgi:hypothetical protein